MATDPRSSETVVKAILDNAAHPNEPAIGLVQQMLGAIGYDLHDPANKARANDQLIRARASELLAQATKLLQALEGKFREEYVPPASREQPFPPADVMKALKGLDALRRRVGECSSAVLTQETPGTDGVWARLRNERDLLAKFLGVDIDLIAGAQTLLEAAGALGVADVRQRQLAAVETPLVAVESAFRARRALLG